MPNDHDLSTTFIDLGLPSGTLWGKGNVDANVPEEVGLIIEVGKINLLLQKDEDYKSLLPTKEQFIELFNPEYTTIEKHEEKNAWGVKITSKVNGKSIYLPVGEVWVNHNGIKFLESGAYCTSSLYKSEPIQGLESTEMNVLYFINENSAGADNVVPSHQCMVRYITKH